VEEGEERLFLSAPGPLSVNILQVIPQLEAGGAERTTLEVAQAVVADGGRALVASEGGRMEAELAALGGELVRLPMATKNPFTAWKNAAALTRLIREQNIDLVHARSRAPAWSAKLAADRAGVPYVTTYHGTYNARSGLKRWYNSIMAKGVRVIAKSEFIRAHVLEQHAIDPDRITVIPRGVDLDRFNPDVIEPARLEAIRTAWALADEADSLVLLLPARLTRWKGQVDAVEAMIALKEQGVTPLPRLVLAGDPQGRDAYVAELEGLIAEHDLGDRVRLVGHCADMAAAFAVCDVVMTPSNEPEAFGRSAAEAGAMQRPVIAADHGGAREVIIAGETGWRVTPGDADAIAAAINEAIAAGAEGRQAIGTAAAERIRTLYSARSLQTATLRVYREVLEC
jgi:glycosyltransferase involved in cell wall biosynthesis